MPSKETRSGIELLDRVELHVDRIALKDPETTLSYAALRQRAEQVARSLTARLGVGDLEERRVAFLVTPSCSYPVVQWGIWRAGGIAVPLCVSHPLPEIEYVLRDADASLVVYSDDHADVATKAATRVGIEAVPVEALFGVAVRELVLPKLQPDRRAMILYTSGTTGRPKGVVTTHRNIAAQIQSLVEAWAWSDQDRILNVLPLHHLHGILNVTCCALWSGAQCEMAPRFDARSVWQHFARDEATVFMAVPTIYTKLLAAWHEASESEQRQGSAGARRLRLMVSGSAALPKRVLEAWQEVSGHRLLERYGMTETGMILSNPLDGQRLAGSVGVPLPGVSVRFVDGGEVAPRDASPGTEARGEIEVRGDGVFLEYWRRPQETEKAFCQGWFRTGDVAERRSGRYSLLGRTSVDILKTGGYKVSALEIEDVLLTHPAIRECAVVGLSDEEWGQRVAAAVVADTSDGDDSTPLTLDELRAWGKERLAPYKVPTRLLLVDELPRNALGKVTKPAVIELFA